MEVIINGIKYIPETDKTIEVGGIVYKSVADWLLNIHSRLLDEWVNHLKEGEPVNQSPEVMELFKRTTRFKEYTKEFLGFEYNKDNYKFVEVKKIKEKGEEL